MIPKPLLEEINRWINDKKYGNLQINFSGGKILNVNRVESLKVETLGAIGGASASISPSGTSTIDEH
jgi:hypothetical protein